MIMRSPGLGSWLAAGAVAGLAGGAAFGAAMAELGMLPTVAAIVRADSVWIGAIVHVAISAAVGAGFGALIWRQRVGAGETLFWGLTYGALWWFIGPLTLLPLLLGDGLAWDVPSARAAFPSLLGHLLWGAVTALALVLMPFRALRRERLTRPTLGAVARGAVAGMLAAWLIGVLLSAQGRLASFTAMAGDASSRAAWPAALVVGAVAGIGFALLYPRSSDGAGAGLVRGTMYGLLWWVAASRTLLPLLGGDHLPWSVAAAQQGFAALIGWMLAGAALVLWYGWLGSLWRALFADDVGGEDDEGAGTQGLRAIGRGAVAGVIGGLLFTLVMVQIDFLPTVASLIGAGSAATGLLVHLAIAVVIGAAYGLLFRRQSADLGSALGWGVAYGFVWWLIGPLTLLPLLLGVAPEWTAERAGALMASLVGHLAYGAGLGITFFRLEARFSPWWIPREMMEAARIERRRQQLLGSAPALWALVVVMALTLPIVLGTTE